MSQSDKKRVGFAISEENHTFVKVQSALKNLTQSEYIDLLIDQAREDNKKAP